ncbi:MAG: hypothetical protein LBS05_00925 [Tannerellaceae bacterium]|jgi:hypothetical protein|nr:hypothetical protein [Tannerellaceae bacterium]
MVTRKRWLPTTRLGLFDVGGLVTTYVDANIVRLGMQETTVIGKYYQEFFDGPWTTYKNNIEKWRDPSTRTKEIIDKMIAAEKEFIPALRKLYKILVANPAVTDADLERMGLPKRPTNKRTPAPVATVPPGFEVMPTTGHQLRITYFPIDEANKRGKPAGQSGVEIKWGFSEVPIQDPEELDHSTLDTASPALVAFSGNDMGRKIYVALRWINTRGIHGPWSLPVETTVP